MSFLARLQSRARASIKQNRGNGGQGVWKVELSPRLQAPICPFWKHVRGSVPQSVPARRVPIASCGGYFADGGCIIDQPFQAASAGRNDPLLHGHRQGRRLRASAYQGADSAAARRPDSPAAQPGPRIMHPATAPEFQALRVKMESEWVPQMMQLFGLARDALPIIWDADFLYGPRTTDGEDTYVLVRDQCELGDADPGAGAGRRSRSSQRNASHYSGNK